MVAALPGAHAELGTGAIAGELGVGLLFGFLLNMLDEMLAFAGQVLGADRAETGTATSC